MEFFLWNTMYTNKYINIQRVLTFNEALKLFLTDGFRLHLNLQSHQNCEEELVGLVQTAGRVRESQVGQILDDVLYPTCGKRRAVRMRHGDVKQLQKLAQWRLIHTVDAAHRHDQKI